MKVALVVGPCPPGRCGVGDYTACLSNALAASGVDAHVIASKDWSLAGAFKVRDNLKDFELVHIQYPTLGFGYKLGAQTLSLLQKCVITLHEASQRRIWRKLSLLPFMVRPRHVIFTSEYERTYVTARAPWIARLSSIIPVPSSIRVFPEKRTRALGEIVYFGLILPKKGLDQVVELSRLIKTSGLPLRVRIIGGRRPERIEYFERLRADTAALPVVWDLDLREKQVAEKLASSAVAYLPFPDGASERRTSLKAALTNGIAVITTTGPHTPENMKSFLKFAQSPQQAFTIACSLLQSPDERAKMAANARPFLQQCSWEHVAELHLEVYQRLLEARTARAPLRIRDSKENL